jgi:hypothetical protein
MSINLFHTISMSLLPLGIFAKTTQKPAGKNLLTQILAVCLRQTICFCKALGFRQEPRRNPVAQRLEEIGSTLVTGQV